MKLFRYRWIVAACCTAVLIAGGYVFDLQAKLHDYARLNAREVSIKKQLRLREQAKAAGAVVKVSAEHSKPLRDFVRMVNERNIQIVSLTNEILEVNVEDSGNYQIILSCDYFLLLQLLKDIANDDRYEIGNLTITAEKSHKINFVFVLRILDFMASANKTFNDVVSMANPFCNEDETSLTRIESEGTTKFSLNYLRLLGVAVQSNASAAIVEFPDGTIKSLVVNSLLGSEGGRITEINNTHIVVLMPNGARHFLIKN